MFHRIAFAIIFLFSCLFAADTTANVGATVTHQGITFDVACNAAPYTVSGKTLPSLFKDAVKALPKQEGFDQSQVVLIRDFPGWVKCNHLETVPATTFNPEQAGAFSNNGLPMYIVEDQPDLEVAISNYTKGTADYLRYSIGTWMVHELAHIQFKKEQVAKAETEGKKFEYSPVFRLRSEEFALTAETTLRQDLIRKGKLPAGCQQDQDQAVAVLRHVQSDLAKLEPTLTAAR